jgi:chorismate-pyruvate lyase
MNAPALTTNVHPLTEDEFLALSPLQRVLLVTDGTVTDILGAFLGEEIRIIKLAQEATTATQSIDDLALPLGDPVLYRRVLLVGAHSHDPLIAAESQLALARLPLALRTALLETSRPIGQLLLEFRVETFREILQRGRTENAEVARIFGLPADTVFIERTYVVYAHGMATMRITERFPMNGFQS